jgi:hypothetical protein
MAEMSGVIPTHTDREREEGGGQDGVLWCCASDCGDYSTARELKRSARYLYEKDERLSVARAIYTSYEGVVRNGLGMYRMRGICATIKEIKVAVT